MAFCRLSHHPHLLTKTRQIGVHNRSVVYGWTALRVVYVGVYNPYPCERPLSVHNPLLCTAHGSLDRELWSCGTLQFLKSHVDNCLSLIGSYHVGDREGMKKKLNLLSKQDAQKPTGELRREARLARIAGALASGASITDIAATEG